MSDSLLSPIKILRINKSTEGGKLSTTGEDGSNNIAYNLMSYIWGDKARFLLSDMHRLSAREILTKLTPFVRRPKYGCFIEIKGDNRLNELLQQIDKFTKEAPQSSPFILHLINKSYDPTTSKEVFTLNRYITAKDILTNESAVKTNLSSAKEPTPSKYLKSRAALEDCIVRANSGIISSDNEENTINAYFNTDQGTKTRAQLSGYYQRDGEFPGVDPIILSKFYLEDLKSGIDNLKVALIETSTESTPIVDLSGYITHDTLAREIISAIEIFNSILSTWSALPQISLQPADGRSNEYIKKLYETTFDYYNVFIAQLDRLSQMRSDFESRSENPTYSDIIVRIRLFPQDAPISYPTNQFTTQIISGSKILQTALPRTHTMINFMGNIALNTLDTQWLDIYACIFSYLINEMNNPKVDLIVGDYRIKDCYLAAPPAIVNSQNDVETFNLSFISETLTLKEALVPSNFAQVILRA